MAVKTIQKQIKNDNKKRRKTERKTNTNHKQHERVTPLQGQNPPEKEKNGKKCAFINTDIQTQKNKVKKE